MAVPRNLVYVFLIAIIIAFGGMIYVVYSEKDLSTFMNASFTDSLNENVVVHPLFQHLKAHLKNIDSVPRVNEKDLTTKIFY